MKRTFVMRQCEKNITKARMFKKAFEVWQTCKTSKFWTFVASLHDTNYHEKLGYVGATPQLSGVGRGRIPDSQIF